MPPAAAEGLPPGKQHGLQKRDLPERERQIPYNVNYTWNLKYDMNELIYKQNQTHRLGEQTYGRHGGRMGERDS